MAKSTHSDAPSGGSRPMIETMQPEAMTEACNRLLKHMDEMTRVWVGTLQQANSSSWDLASRLARCSDPMEMNRLCTDWLAERRETMMADGKRLSEMWLRMCEQELATAPVRPFMGESQPAMGRMAAAE